MTIAGRKTTLVLGIGNTLRKDDGAGIRVIELLREGALPPGVSVLDGGTAGIDLLTYIEGVDRLIIVDALLADGLPGDIRVLAGNAIKERDLFVSGHYGRLSDILDLAAELGTRPETSVVGIIPRDCDSYEMGLSPEVAAGVEKAADMIRAMVSDKNA